MSTLRSRNFGDMLTLVGAQVLIWALVTLLIAMVMTMAFDSCIPTTRLVGTVVDKDFSGHYIVVDCGSEKLSYGGLLLPCEYCKGDVVEINVDRSMFGSQKLVSSRLLYADYNNSGQLTVAYKD